MYISTLLPISIILSLSAAQTTTSACAAQPVLEACLASTEAIVAGCSSTDYQCLCDKWSSVVTCFLQCPNDSRYTGVYNTQQTYCTDASLYATTTTSAISRAVSSWVSTTTSASGTSTAESGAVRVTSTGTGTASSTASATGNAGVKGAQIAGGLMVAVAGFAGAIL